MSTIKVAANENNSGEFFSLVAIGKALLCLIQNNNFEKLKAKEFT
ncbi:hypothetical protein VINI7043_20203 [Vibrio nigripulchritudo ATCC 27043]|nr:hypothetical protein VINI7043_20203 [Vibrio nigripulchritudo ATCC 27043]